MKEERRRNTRRLVAGAKGRKYTFESITHESDDREVQAFIEANRKEFYKEWWPYIAQYSDDAYF